MSNRTPIRSARSAQGTSVVELLVSVVCTSIITMAMFSVLWMNTAVQTKSGNNLDAANAARVAIERIGRDAREARSLGDVFGVDVVLEAGPPVIMGTEGSASFPSAKNPVYGAGQTPPVATWPAAWPTSPGPAPSVYTLSNTCLIIQVPIYDANGWPTEIPIGSGNPAVTAAMGNQANVETHIYQIVPDPNRAGEFLLQYYVVPGAGPPTSPNSGYVPTNHSYGPQTIVKGIIGPRDNGGNLVVFQYIARRKSLDDPAPGPYGAPKNVVNGTRLANFTGVIVNLEIRRQEYSAPKSVTLAFKQEVFIRNNAMSTSVGEPP